STLPHADGSVTTAKLANGSVATPKIADLAVTAAKVANQTLTADKFVPGALTNETQNALRITALEGEVDEHLAETVTGVFNVVTGFGADPTGVSDSSSAFINAVAAATPTGGTIEFPRGKFKLSSKVIIDFV